MIRVNRLPTAAEFGDLVREEGEIGVTTDPITLDDVMSRVDP